uniref:Enoyl CoA hydratase domain containing 2 n=1 Tax=Hippocampus comes TaxID=109280 RepID=A0A3Q2YAH6_HIPCM
MSSLLLRGLSSSRAGSQGARVLATVAGFSGAQGGKQQHTEAASGVKEVELKRLPGKDEGRRNPSLNNYNVMVLCLNICSFCCSGIVEVLMCRHHARNALGHVFVSQMKELVSMVSSDSAVRVLVFRSLIPGVFCAGADLKERALMNSQESDLFVHGLRSLMTQIALLPMPTIAAIDGVAVGGGLELALACDLRTAASSAQMGLIETTRGLLPGAGGSQRLPRTVGMALAKELIFTGRRVGGQAAAEMGLVNRAIEQDQTGEAAYAEALALAREILPQAPIAVRMAKEAMNRGMERWPSRGCLLCWLSLVIPTRDRQEGMAAFIEKRPPFYIGE